MLGLAFSVARLSSIANLVSYNPPLLSLRSFFLSSLTFVPHLFLFHWTNEPTNVGELWEREWSKCGPWEKQAATATHTWRWPQGVSSGLEDVAQLLFDFL